MVSVNNLNAKQTLVESASIGSMSRSTVARSSFSATVVGSGTNGRMSFIYQSLWQRQSSWLNEVKNSKMQKIANSDLWFDVKMHCAKSCRPFELFAN